MSDSPVAAGQAIEAAFEIPRERDAIQSESEISEFGKSWDEMSHEQRAIFISNFNRPDRELDAAIAKRDRNLPAAPEPFVMPQHWKRLDVAQVRLWDCEPLHPIVADIIAKKNFIFVAAQSQTGKTLFGLYAARKFVQGGWLFGKYQISRVKRVIYLLLEDPDRRAQDRIVDNEHEFESLEPGKFIIIVAPSFSLTDDRMFEWLRQLLISEGDDVFLIVDTYQKSTPGLNSFDDEKQGQILHKLANLTRELSVTLMIMDHFRKAANGGAGKGKAREVSMDDIKGTGGKAQNADCVILMERTADKKQIKFQAFSKDFDNPVRILLNVAPRGSKEPKFTYAGDLGELGEKSSDRGAITRNKIFEAMTPDDWLSVPGLSKTLAMANSTVQNHLKRLIVEGKVRDNDCDGKLRRYQRIAECEIGDKNDTSAKGGN